MLEAIEQMNTCPDLRNESRVGLQKLELLRLRKW
jgi:hypothetical protein